MKQKKIYKGLVKQTKKIDKGLVKQKKFDKGLMKQKNKLKLSWAKLKLS